MISLFTTSNYTTMSTRPHCQECNSTIPRSEWVPLCSCAKFTCSTPDCNNFRNVTRKVACTTSKYSHYVDKFCTVCLQSPVASQLKLDKSRGWSPTPYKLSCSPFGDDVPVVSGSLHASPVYIDYDDFCDTCGCDEYDKKCDQCNPPSILQKYQNRYLKSNKKKISSNYISNQFNKNKFNRTDPMLVNAVIHTLGLHQAVSRKHIVKVPQICIYTDTWDIDNMNRITFDEKLANWRFAAAPMTDKISIILQLNQETTQSDTVEVPTKMMEDLHKMLEKSMEKSMKKSLDDAK